MRDGLNREIQIGDVVAYIVSHAGSAHSLSYGVVDSFSPKGVRILRENSYMYYDREQRQYVPASMVQHTHVVTQSQRITIISRSTPDERWEP